MLGVRTRQAWKLDAVHTALPWLLACLVPGTPRGRVVSAGIRMRGPLLVFCAMSNLLEPAS